MNENEPIAEEVELAATNDSGAGFVSPGLAREVLNEANEIAGESVFALASPIS